MLGTRINIHRRKHLKKSIWGGQIMRGFFLLFSFSKMSDMSPLVKLLRMKWMITKMKNVLNWGCAPKRRCLWATFAPHTPNSSHLIMQIPWCVPPLFCRCFSFVLVLWFCWLFLDPLHPFSQSDTEWWFRLFKQPRPLMLGRRLALGRMTTPLQKRKKNTRWY